MEKNVVIFVMRDVHYLACTRTLVVLLVLAIPKIWGVGTKSSFRGEGGGGGGGQVFDRGFSDFVAPSP